MIKEILICLALTNMNGVVNEHNVCSNVELISELSEKHKIDSHLFVSIMWAESRFKEEAKSNGGACGITQVLPKYTRPRVDCEDLKNPKVGIYYGYKTFSKFYNQYAKGDVDTSLCAYNAGFRCKDEELTEKEKLVVARARKYYIPTIKKFNRRLKRKTRKLRKQYTATIDFINKFILKNDQGV